jgi:hypothetical protein
MGISNENMVTKSQSIIFENNLLNIKEKYE